MGMKSSNERKRTWADWLIYLIWAFFLFALVYDILGYPIRAVFWAVSLFILIFLYYKTRISKTGYFLVAALLLMHAFGELYFGFFYTSPYYDKIIHLLSPILLGAVFYSLIGERIPDKKIRLFFAASLVLSLELIWEIIEYFFDSNTNTLLTGVQQVVYGKLIRVLSPYADTIYDMLDNLIGAAVFVLGGLFLLRKRRK
jgi:hypothetical protein